MSENNLKETRETQTKKPDNDTSCCKESTKPCDGSSCCGEIKKSCDNSSCYQGAEMKKALKDISCYAKCNKNWLNFIVGAGVVILLLLMGVFLYFCSNCYQNKNEETKPEVVKIKEGIRVLQKICEESKKSTCELNKLKTQPMKYIDLISHGLDIQMEGEGKWKDSSFNLSMQTKQNSNSRSDCFWFIIVLIIALFLILLFYLISYSSRETKLLQFVIEWNEQEKEITLKKIEKCKEIRLKEIEKCKEINIEKKKTITKNKRDSYE